MKVTIGTEFIPNATYNLVAAGFYGDQSPALELYSGEPGGSPEARVSVCIENESPADGNVLIKDWSENTGLLDELIRVGAILPAIRSVDTGLVVAFECPMCAELVEEVERRRGP